ncbi:hypothetical protein DB346_19735 [Verrucomicrobia bacterium LW23]|nr:hypothetical protein DB346_19735 [Verrucomicrobia bacterium LW23]
MFTFSLHPRYSLSANLFWRFFCISLPLLIVGGVIASSYSEQLLRKQAWANLAAIANDKAGKVEAYARSKLYAVELIASQPYMPMLLAATPDSPEKQALFHFLHNLSGYSNLYLFSPEGKLLFAQTAGEVPAPELARTVDRTRTLLSAEISDYTYDEATKIPSVYVSAPVFDSKGSVCGIVAARLSNEEIYRVAGDYSNLGQTGETVMIQATPEGIVVVTPLRNKPDAAFRLRFARAQAPTAMVAAVEGVRTQSVTRDYRGQEVLSVSRYLPSLGWGLIVKMDVSEIFAPAAKLRQGMWIGGAILVLLFIVGAQVAAQSINQPLSRLTEAARRIEQGDLGARVDLEQRKDEFSLLAHTFNAMIGQIQDGTNKLRETNESLEQKVDDRTQSLAVKTQEAERANRAKSEFLANMSHEIRTPLNAILGYAQILSRDAALHPFQRDAIGTIIKSSDHMLRLINEILDLSKIDAGRMELYPTDFRLRKMLEEMEELFEPQCDEKKLGFRILMDDRERSFPVHGDEGKIRQVLINLIGNAVKFTERGSVRVTIRREAQAGQEARGQGTATPTPTGTATTTAVGAGAAPVSAAASALEAAPLVFFEVLDTGPGIPEQMRQMVFEPFQQGPQRTPAGGTGLGLAIARRQVEVMGGRLQLDSPPEGGARFSFTLPLPPARRALKENAKEIERLAAGFRVRALVVDDVRENRDILSHMLGKIGCEVETAEDGPEAIARACAPAQGDASLGANSTDYAAPPPEPRPVLVPEGAPRPVAPVRPMRPRQASRFDIVFMDIRLGAGSGLEAVRDIQQRLGPGSPVIVAVSASAFEHERAMYLKAGCDDFIAKPVRAERVFAALADLLGVQFVQRAAEAGDGDARTVDLTGVPLPEGLVDRMVVAAELHSMTVLRKCIKEVEALGPDEARLAAHLRDFLSSCDMVAIQAMIAQIPVKGADDETIEAGAQKARVEDTISYP